MLEKILSNLNVKQLGLHIVKYSELYTNPLKVWKAIIDIKPRGYSLLILHIIYYFVILLSLSSVKILSIDAMPIVGYIGIEVLATFIPLTVLALPFIAYRWIFKISENLNSFFRLLLILKLQLIPIILLLFAISRFNKIESPYLLIYNFLGILLISYIALFPCLLGKIQWWKKLIWVASNYIYYNVFILIIIALYDQASDVKKIVDNLQLQSPATEFIETQNKYQGSHYSVIDKYDFVLIKIDVKNDNGYIQENQFVTFPLIHYFEARKTNMANTIAMMNLYREKSKGKTKEEALIEFGAIQRTFPLLPENKELSLRKLDSLRNVFNTKFYSDLHVTDSLRNAVKFPSNKNCYQALFNYLNEYNKSYINKSLSSYNSAIGFDTVYLEQHHVGILVYADTSSIAPLRKRAEMLYEERYTDIERDFFLFGIAIYPAIVLYEQFTDDETVEL